MSTPEATGSRRLASRNAAMYVTILSMANPIGIAGKAASSANPIPSGLA